MDDERDLEQIELDRARELLQKTVDALSKAGQPDDQAKDVEGLRELIERLRRISAEPDVA